MVLYFALCPLYLVLALLLGNDGPRVSGWFVIDGITLLDSAQIDAQRTVQQIFTEYPAGAALAVINALMVGIHPLVPALLNFGILLLVFGHWTRGRAPWIGVLPWLVPYYVCAFVLPSKDILVAALFMMVLGTMRREAPLRLLPVSVLALAMFFVRDGYAVILMASFVMISAAERVGLSPRKLVLLVVAGAAIFWTLFESVLEDSFIYVRAMGVASQSEVLDVGTTSSPTGYLIRLIGNATNLAFRPVFFDVAGAVHLLSVSYWVSGLTLLVALHWCWRGLRSPDVNDRRLGLIGLLSLILVSITPYVQPRYLLPICLLLPRFTFASGPRLRRTYLIAVGISLAMALGYSIAGNYPPPAERIPFDLLSNAY